CYFASPPEPYLARRRLSNFVYWTFPRQCRDSKVLPWSWTIVPFRFGSQWRLAITPSRFSIEQTSPYLLVHAHGARAWSARTCLRPTVRSSPNRVRHSTKSPLSTYASA